MTIVRLTLDMPEHEPVRAGDGLRSSGGSLYRVATVRHVKRRTRVTPGDRWAILAERVSHVPDTVATHEFAFYSRGRRGSR